MIIAFAGRKQSGKTTLAKILLERGFKKISFADKLKELVASLYGWPLEELYSKKEEILNKAVVWDEEIANKLLSLIGAEKFQFKIEEKILKSRREALQFIGSDILRKHNPQFHINSFLEKIENNSNINYVCDDIRFCNELRVLKKLNAICIFILRPNYFNYSNHKSEIDLNRTMFDHIIVNNTPLKIFTNKCKNFVDYLFVKKRNPFGRDKLVKLLKKHDYKTKEVAAEVECSRDKIVWWASKYLIHIPRKIYKYNDNIFLNPTKEASYWAGVLSGDGCVKTEPNQMVELGNKDLELVDGLKKFVASNKPIYNSMYDDTLFHHFVISNPLIIEDMKRWCLNPRKSRINLIPDCIKDDKNLLNYWVMGLIDSDGSIFISNNQLNISILASKGIIDFLSHLYKMRGSINQEKKIENLYCITYNGSFAEDIFKQIYHDGIGLKRKWDVAINFSKNRKDLVGEKIGKLRVVKDLGLFERKDGKRERWYECICDCGRTIRKRQRVLNRKDREPHCGYGCE